MNRVEREIKGSSSVSESILLSSLKRAHLFKCV